MRIRMIHHVAVAFAAFLATTTWAQNSNAPVNLALVAKASASFVSGDTSVAALNDGYTPRNSRDNRRGSYGNWNRTGTQWVEYDWSHFSDQHETDFEVCIGGMTARACICRKRAA